LVDSVESMMMHGLANPKHGRVSHSQNAQFLVVKFANLYCTL